MVLSLITVSVRENKRVVVRGCGSGFRGFGRLSFVFRWGHLVTAETCCKARASRRCEGDGKLGLQPRPSWKANFALVMLVQPATFTCCCNGASSRGCSWAHRDVLGDGDVPARRQADSLIQARKLYAF